MEPASPQGSRAKEGGGIRGGPGPRSRRLCRSFYERRFLFGRSKRDPAGGIRGEEKSAFIFSSFYSTRTNPIDRRHTGMQEIWK